MKMGIRTPSIKKSVKARTTGKMKRAVKKSVNPLYGKKGMGYINDPKKAVYNKVYNKTTVDVRPSSLVNPTTSKKHKSNNNSSIQEETASQVNNTINYANLSNDEINDKINELNISRKKSIKRCPIMFILFFVFYMISLFSGNFFTWIVTIITCLWAIGSGTNVNVCKKEIKKLESHLK